MAERSCLQQTSGSCDSCPIQREFVTDLNKKKQTPIQVVRAQRAEMSCPPGVTPEARFGIDPLDEDRGFVLVSDLRAEELERFAQDCSRRLAGTIPTGVLAQSDFVIPREAAAVG